MKYMSLRFACPASTQAFNQRGFGSGDVWNKIHFPIKLGQQIRQGISLYGGAREAVQKGAFFTIRAGKSGPDHADGYIVRNQFPFIHVRLRQFSEFGRVLYVFPKKISRGYVWQSGGFSNKLRLSAFTNAGGSEKNNESGHG
jgi:hypothetical protein